MNHGAPNNRPAPRPLACEWFLARVHGREDLASEERARFHEHHECCGDCRVRLVEAERLDDLLLAWLAPPPREGTADRVLARLTGAAAHPCEDFLEDLHHHVAHDLEPWREELLLEHLHCCESCRTKLDEAEELRGLWQGWCAPPRRPQDSCEMAEAVLRSLRGAPAGRRPWVRTWEWFGSEVRLPRVAALLLGAATLFAAVQLVNRSSRGDRSPPSSPPSFVSSKDGASDSVAELPSARGRPLSVRPVADFRSTRGGFEQSLRLSRAAHDSQTRFTPPGQLLRNADVH